MKSVQHTHHSSFFSDLQKPVMLLLMLFCTPFLIAQEPPDRYISKLRSEIAAVAEDSVRIEKLSQLAYYYSDYLGNNTVADSLSQAAVDLAESGYRRNLLLLSYQRYIECNDAGLSQPKALSYALQALKISKETGHPLREWESCRNLTKVYLSLYNYGKALGSSYQALALADVMSDNALKAESYLLIGQSLEGDNQKIEAFRNFLAAVALAEKADHKGLLKKCYAQLSEFYNQNHMYEKAIAYKIKQVDLVLQSHPVDSAEYMWTQYDLQVIGLNSNHNKISLLKVKEILDWAIAHHAVRLKQFEISLYRTHLIEAEEIDQLYSLYTKLYPAEFSALAVENPSAFYRMKSYFCELENKTDSAYYYLKLSEQLVRDNPNKIMQSNFYHRYGQFLTRQGKPAEAINMFRLSYDLARKASYFEYMLSASKHLETLYSQIGDFNNAYQQAVLGRKLADSISLLTRNDELLTLEIDHEAKQREFAAEREHEEMQRRHNLQYTGIVIVTLSLFVILLMLGSLKVPSWIIKMLGFFSFIMLFEFIIMIADHKIYEITENEPWKILSIKIGLIAFLLPFHHWIEKKVIHYLIEHKLIRIPRFSTSQLIRKPSRKKINTEVQEA